MRGRTSPSASRRAARSWSGRSDRGRLPAPSAAAWRSQYRSRSWRDHQPVADAAYGLDQQRVGRVALDLAAEAVDLNVDGALADGAAVAGKRKPRHRIAGRGRQHPQHLAFPVGKMDGLLAALELAAPDVEQEFAKAHRL